MNRFGGNRYAAAKYQAQAQQQAPSGLASLLGFGGGQDLQSSQSQLYGSYSSGYGGGSPGGSCFSIDICPDLILAAIAAAAAAAAFGLYIAITQAGRRKKRSDGSVDESFLDSFVRSWAPQFVGVSNLFHLGLEEFEEKIDKIAEGEDDGENSWISKIYNQFSFFNDGQNSLEENDMDGLEPPILDETWGLGLRNAAKDITANTTLEEPVEILDLKLEDKMENTKTKREAVDENDEEANEEDTEEKCRVDMWRCLSKVIEGGLHYMDKPEGLMGLAKKTMFKVAFHGGFNNVWNGVMTIPEARQIKHCMTEHTECVSYEILRREAQQTLDPNDPMLDMYERQRAEKKANKVEEVENKKRKKKERLIVNPEFVEALDSGDGSVQYDEDYDRQNEV